MATLPSQTMPFIGRADEIAAITRQLADPACSLLTLVGPGGMGKTRLAIQVAQTIAQTNPPADGIHFVDLQPLNSGDLLVTVLANALNLVFSGADEPHSQLLNYLNGRAALLLLDNFEHILDSAGFLPDIIKIAPDVKLLVTSREALNLQEEWVWQVNGLDVPGEGTEAPIDSYSAVQLFVERARRVRQGFVLAGQELSVTRTCQLVEGMPLALELAASWTRSLSCAEIATEVRRGLDFLTTNKRNMLEHHRSMQVVFDRSWQLLTEAERIAFPQLSVFRGGFRREAAEQVAGASLAVLSGLVDKSFLRLSAAGRYSLHELIRQYAEVHLETVPGAKSEARQRHCLYYADFLHQRQPTLRTPQQATALDEIEAEFNNIRLSWQWAVEYGMAEEIHRSMHSLYVFCHIRAQALEGERLFELAIKHFEQEDSATLAYLLLGNITLSWFNGKDRDHHQFLRAIHLARTLWVDDEIALQLRSYHWVRETLTAQKHFDDQQMEQVYHEFLERFRTNHQPWGAAYMLFCLGDLMDSNGKLIEAENYFRQSLNNFLQIGDRWASAWSSMGLAWVMGISQRYQEALQFWEQHQEVVTEVGDWGGVVYALVQKANVARTMQDYHAAKLYVTQAIKSYLESGSQFVQLDMVFSSLIAVFMSEGRYERAAELSSFLREQADSASAHRVLGTTRQVLDSLAQQLSPDTYRQAVERGKKLHLRTILEQLLVELSAYSPPSPDVPQVDTLTERELDVLRLTAAGRSNRQIADELVLTLNTVKSHIQHIYGKLGVASRTQAVARARDLNLL